MNVLRYAQWMQEAGYSCILFCVADTPLHKEAAATNLPVINVRRNKKYADLLNAFNLRKLFRKQRIDICWYRDTRDTSVLAITKVLSGKRFKLLYQQAMQLGIKKTDIAHTIRFSQIDAWVSTLPFLAKQVTSHTRVDQTKIHVVPLGMDDANILSWKEKATQARASYHLNEHPLVAGIIGRIDELKGQHVAIEALSILRKKGVDIHLLIVGEPTLHEGDAYLKSLHQQVADLGLHSYVHFHPFTKDVGVFYSAIDQFWLCSKGETFGTVTIEAMAAAKAIIATNSSGTPELLDHGKCGLLYEPFNSEELAAQSIKLIFDQALKTGLQQRARQRYGEEYSKSISVERMHQIIQQMLHSS